MYAINAHAREFVMYSTDNFVWYFSAVIYRPFPRIPAEYPGVPFDGLRASEM